MPIINKYNYVKLDRKSTDGKRLYETPDGAKVPSVTTILSATAPKEKMQALMEWRKRVGPEQAQTITTEAAARGTRMHKFLEDYCINGELSNPGTNPYSKQSYDMAQVVVEQGMCNVNEVWGVEVPLYYSGLYAGTADGVGVHLKQDAILDYKQTNKPKLREWIDDYFLQLSAYMLAHDEVHGTKIKKGVVLMCVKPVEIAAGKWDKPVYQEFIVEGLELEKYKNLWWDRVEQYFR
jgi:genome maintenance exonuclease 1